MGRRVSGTLILSLLPAILIAQPKLSVVGGSRFDLGEISVLSPVTRKLTLKNTGSDTLSITDVSATCGCTGTLMSNDLIPPGDSGILSITFNPRNIRGRAEKAVSMNTNDPEQKHMRITFSAVVAPVLEVDLDYLVVRTQLDSVATDTFFVKNTSSVPVQILSVTPTDAEISVAPSALHLNPNDSAAVTCVFTPKRVGTVKGNIIIRTDHPKAPSLNLRFFALVSGKKTADLPTGQR